MIEIGLKYTSELTVTDAVTAIAVGSGDMPVLATPIFSTRHSRWFNTYL
jgi:predicted thioesterase